MWQQSEISGCNIPRENCIQGLNLRIGCFQLLVADINAKRASTTFDYLQVKGEDFPLECKSSVDVNVVLLIREPVWIFLGGEFAEWLQEDPFFAGKLGNLIKCSAPNREMDLRTHLVLQPNKN